MSLGEVEAVRQVLKQWEHEFQQRNGRKPKQIDVKRNASIESQYRKYAELKKVEKLRPKARKPMDRARLSRISRGFVPFNSLPPQTLPVEKDKPDENTAPAGSKRMFSFLDVSDLKEVKKTKSTANLYEELPAFDRKPQLPAGNIELDGDRRQTDVGKQSVCKVPLREQASNHKRDDRHDLEKRPVQSLDVSASKEPKKIAAQKTSTTKRKESRPSNKVFGKTERASSTASERKSVTSCQKTSTTKKKESRPSKKVSGKTEKDSSTASERKTLTQNFVRMDLKRGYRGRGRGRAGGSGRQWKSARAWMFEQKKKRAEKINDSRYTELLEDNARQREIELMKEREQEARAGQPGRMDLAQNDVQDVHDSEAMAEYGGSMDVDGARKVLVDQFGYVAFKPGQEPAVQRVLNHLSTLLILPTGGGKSLVYQLPAFMLKGLVLVVTPLLSLMKDQLKNLPTCLPGAVWSSTQTIEEVHQVITRLREGALKILFVSPERLHTQGFQKTMRSLPAPGIAFVCIDEAHCVSQWSHNFRPTFRRLNSIIRQQLNVQCILALTATATQQTVDSVCNSLQIEPEGVLLSSINRNNLFLTVSRDHDRLSALMTLLRSDRLKDLDSIIVYVHFQRTADELAIRLNGQGLRAMSYHSGKSWKERKEIQDGFMSNKYPIVVATIAFGMGLDKQDVRVVIHYNTPQSMEHYVQEIGRAGRDGQPSHCHTFFDEDDVDRFRSLAHSDAVDLEQVISLLQLIFRPDYEKGTLVALSKAKQLLQLDLRSSVVETLLLFLELELNEPLIMSLPSLHNIIALRFCKTPTEVLSKQSNVIEYIVQNCRYRSGSYSVNIVQVASGLKVMIADVQRTLLVLKSMREVSLTWKDESFCMLLQDVPPPDRLLSLAEEMLQFSREHEQIQLRKVSIVSQVLKSVAKERLSDVGDVQSESEMQKILQSDIEEYFKCATDDKLLEAVEQHLPDYEKLHNCLKREKPALLNSDIRLFLFYNEGRQFTARQVSRILHGISSPLFPFKEWHKQEQWGKYVSYPFEDVLEAVEGVMAALGKELKEKQ